MYQDISNLTVIGFYGRFFVIFLLTSCTNENVSEKPIYNGPIMKIENIHSKISDSLVTKMHMTAPLEEVFENGDRKWKKGIYIVYFDKNGTESTTFEANFAKYTKDKNLYMGVGNVIVKSIKNKSQLNTEELYYDLKKKEFYTEKFVTIKSDDEIHTGEGLRANEDFTWYKITQPTGVISIADSLE